MNRILNITLVGMLAFSTMTSFANDAKTIDTNNKQDSVALDAKKDKYTLSGKVLAKVNGREIKDTEVAEYFSQDDKIKYEDLNSEIREVLLRNYVGKLLLDKVAKDTNVEASKEFQTKLSLEKDKLLLQITTENYLKDKVSDAEVKKQYDDLVASLANKYDLKVSHILVKTEAQAKEVKEKLNKGQKFADLAKQYSIDTSTKDKGGRLGDFILPGSTVPEFEVAAAALKKGAISNPVKTQFGWHIIKLDEKRITKVPSYEDAKKTIENQLKGMELQKWVQELEKQDKVEYIDVKNQ
jgi:peptidylprolyl isomerase/peptidyl-prolyl cis-trans isomerase C